MTATKSAASSRSYRLAAARAAGGVLSLALCAGVVWTMTARKQNRPRGLLLVGDFATNDLAQFGGKEALDKELTVVAAPARAGGQAMRVEINQSEKEQGGSTSRRKSSSSTKSGWAIKTPSTTTSPRKARRPRKSWPLPTPRW